MGFSVNDTVIVFDRIRENQAKLKDKKLDRIVDISLNEMLVRSILTSATVFSTTLVMNIFGEGLVKNFAFTMNIGVIVGVYSSLFIATPVFLAVSTQVVLGHAGRRSAVSLPSSPQPLRVRRPTRQSSAHGPSDAIPGDRVARRARVSYPAH